MKEILSSKVDAYKAQIEKVVMQKCKTQALCLLNPDEILKAFDLKKNWAVVTDWLFLYGCQRYTGNPTTQDEMSLIKIGLRRFIYNLGMDRINRQTTKPTNPIGKTNSFIEKRSFEGYLSKEDLNKAIEALNKVLNKLGYHAFVDLRPNGDDKIVWEPIQ